MRLFITGLIISFVSICAAASEPVNFDCDAYLGWGIKVEFNQDREASVPLDGMIGPLQSELGFAEADYKASVLLKQAELIAEVKRRSLNEAILEVAHEEAGAGIEGYADPDGIFRPVDGHHKLKAVILLLQRHEISLGLVFWKLKVPKANDFRGKSWEKYAKALNEQGLGLLSPQQEQESAAAGESAGQRVQRLPKGFSGMTDSPMRSTVGRFFELNELSGSQFQPMAQFAVGQMLRLAGIEPLSGTEYEPALLGRILELFFRDSRSPGFIAQIVDHARGEEKTTVRTLLEAGRTRYLRIRQELELENGGSTSASAAATVLSSMILETENPLLPEKVLVPVTTDFFAEIYDGAKNLSANAYKIKDVSKLLGLLKDKGPGKLSRNERKELKNARRAMLQQRGIYRFIAQSHKAPKAMDEFTSELGQLNDEMLLWSKAGSKSSAKDHADKIQKLAKQLLDLYEEHPNLFKANADIASTDSFLADQRARLDWIDDALARSALSSGSKLTVEEFHDLRKRVREYMGFFVVWNSISPGMNQERVARMLINLSYRLGKIKDGLLLSPSMGEPSLTDFTSIDPVSFRLIRQMSLIMRGSLP